MCGNKREGNAASCCFKCMWGCLSGQQQAVPVMQSRSAVNSSRVEDGSAVVRKC